MIASVLAAAAVLSVPLPFSLHTLEAASKEASLRLWYDEPASKGTNILSAGMNYDEVSNIWQQQTLPVGNGDIGANVYGEIETEHLQRLFATGNDNGSIDPFKIHRMINEKE